MIETILQDEYSLIFSKVFFTKIATPILKSMNHSQPNFKESRMQELYGAKKGYGQVKPNKKLN